MKLFVYHWPSLRDELKKWANAPTHREGMQPLHADQKKGLAYAYEPEPTAADRARWLPEIECDIEKENETC